MFKRFQQISQVLEHIISLHNLLFLNIVKSFLKDPSKDKDMKLRALAKNSVIEEIERNAIKRPIPGPGTYFAKTRKEEDA